MTVQQAINLARTMKQIDATNYPDALLLQFLNECEGKVQTEFLRIAPDDCQRYTADDMGMELVVEPPHDKLYYTYICAMVDFTNGEYAKYNNSITIANSFIREWAAWFNRTHRREGGEFLGVFLSAYGIAVKHGFEGTEEEWLETLVGPPGVSGVYVGSGEMPEGCHVQVDPSGEVWDESYYDLVLGLNVANTRQLADDGTYIMLSKMTVSDVSVEAGDVAMTAEKIRTNTPVRVLLREIHFYGDTWWYRGVCDATHVAVRQLTAYPSDAAGDLLTAVFVASDLHTSSQGIGAVRITLSTATGQATSLDAQGLV